MHGSLGRAITFNFMVAIGPDFKKQFVDPAPARPRTLNRRSRGFSDLESPANAYGQ
jgi:hypothetical protein